MFREGMNMHMHMFYITGAPCAKESGSVFPCPASWAGMRAAVTLYPEEQGPIYKGS